jgi:DNA mismatch repair ATPase MutS
MEQRTPEAVFREKIKAIDVQLKGLKKTELILSLKKLLFVISGIFFLFRVVLHYAPFSLYAFFFFLFAFVVTAVIHEHYIKQRNFQTALKIINQDEIKAIQGTFLDYGDGGEFEDSDHAYTVDLSIFGNRSVFHFINRTTTSLGKKVLSDWMKIFPDSSQLNRIRDRQGAVQELSEKIDFRQNIQAYGRNIHDSLERLGSVRLLFKESPSVWGNTVLISFIHVFPVLTLSAIVLVFFKFSWLIPVGFALVQGLVNWIFRKKVNRLYKLTSQNFKVLSVYSKIIGEIESETFKSSTLIELQKHCFIKNRPASLYIKKLSSRLQFFEARSSKEIHFLLNNIFFWDLHCVYRIEKWKNDVKLDIDKWFDAVGQFEALSSLGNIRYNHPNWTMPELGDSGFILNAISVGHPLIPSSERINNSIKLDGDTNIVIITGPNMAGKTTFLKTIGVNIVLALAGAPVCADLFKVSPVRVYTSMKVSDSLDKGLSLFYAELQRLKMVLQAILKKEPVFFLIDEMLKGTNELDRHSGAKALICQLIAQHAKGMVATHDLELTKLERDFPEKIWNYFFDGYIEDDKLLFDYLLKKGICTSSNALELMKKIGINVQ